MKTLCCCGQAVPWPGEGVRAGSHSLTIQEYSLEGGQIALASWRGGSLGWLEREGRYVGTSRADCQRSPALLNHSDRARDSRASE